MYIIRIIIIVSNTKGVFALAQTSINIRIDEDVKKSMEIVCKELGLTMSTAFNIFAKKMCREYRIPFDVSYDPLCTGAGVINSKEEMVDK